MDAERKRKIVIWVLSIACIPLIYICGTLLIDNRFGLETGSTTTVLQYLVLASSILWLINLIRLAFKMELVKDSYWIGILVGAPVAALLVHLVGNWVIDEYYMHPAMKSAATELNLNYKEGGIFTRATIKGSLPGAAHLEVELWHENVEGVGPRTEIIVNNTLIKEKTGNSIAESISLAGEQETFRKGKWTIIKRHKSAVAILGRKIMDKAELMEGIALVAAQNGYTELENKYVLPAKNEYLIE